MTEQAENRTSGPSLPPVRGGRQAWAVMLLGAIILVSGIAIGTGGAMLWLGERPPRPPKPVDRAAMAIAEEIARTCELDDQQTERVHQVVAERLAAISKIRQEMVEEVLAEHELLREELQKVLTPEQFAKWSRRMDEARERSWLFGKARRGQRRGRSGRPGRSRHRPGRPRSVEGTFLRFDADDDGKLTRQEVPPWLWPRLSSADADGDGAVSRDEMRNLPPERPRMDHR